MSIRRLLFQWASIIKIQPYIVQRVFSYVQKLQSWWLLPYIIAFPIHWIDKSFSLQLLINFTFNYQSTNTIFHYCHCHMDLIFFVVIQQTCFFQSQMSNWKKFLKLLFFNKMLQWIEFHIKVEDTKELIKP